MSLLNDALRQAEQRQGESRPTVYSGQAIANPGPGRRRAVWLILALLAVTVILVTAWMLQSANPVSGSTVAGLSEPDNRVAISAEPVPRSSEPAASLSAHDPSSAPASTGQADSARKVDTPGAAVTPAPEAIASSEQLSPVRRGQAVTTEVEAASRVTSVSKPATTTQNDAASRPALKPEPESEPQPQPEPEPMSRPPATDSPARDAGANSSDSYESTALASGQGGPVDAQVKSLRETPEAADRRAEKVVSDALKNGELTKARQTLNDLLSRQPAPRSRARFARFLLVDGQPAQALAWLPTTVTHDDPLLRLLRARALLSLGRTSESVAALESRVPPVAGHPEYLVTLATLLQQQGRFSDAALRWSELIAYDNGRSSWWVGLAIALESDQQPGSARRAYQQALALPDLPLALADYCTERLNSLGAG